jgi:hypothetical protein
MQNAKKMLVSLWLQRPPDKRTEHDAFVFCLEVQQNRPDLLAKGYGGPCERCIETYAPHSTTRQTLLTARVTSPSRWGAVRGLSLPVLAQDVRGEHRISLLCRERESNCWRDGSAVCPKENAMFHQSTGCSPLSCTSSLRCSWLLSYSMYSRNFWSSLFLVRLCS